MTTTPDTIAEKYAQLFHETYERLAPEHGYETRKASAVPWADVPANNKALMTAVVGVVLAHLEAQATLTWPEEGDANIRRFMGIDKGGNACEGVQFSNGVAVTVNEHRGLYAFIDAKALNEDLTVAWIDQPGEIG